VKPLQPQTKGPTQRYLRFANALSRGAGWVATWLTTFLVVVVCVDVTTRYLLDFTLIAIQETQWHVFALIFLIGAAYTLRADRHVRVDVFYSNFSPRARAWIDLLGSVLLLLPFCLIGLVLGWKYTLASFAAGEGSPQPGGLPARYLLKAMIPLAMLLLLTQGVASALGALGVIRGRDVQPETAREERAVG
jgi:TRAP-type mannitol/chloroaromatic compound transport system permease small subunit